MANPSSSRGATVTQQPLDPMARLDLENSARRQSQQQQHNHPPASIKPALPIPRSAAHGSLRGLQQQQQQRQAPSVAPSDSAHLDDHPTPDAIHPGAAADASGRAKLPMPSPPITRSSGANWNAMSMIAGGGTRPAGMGAGGGGNTGEGARPQGSAPTSLV